MHRDPTLTDLLFHAIGAGNAEEVGRLLKAGAEADAYLLSDGARRPLVSAVQRGSAEIVRQLLAAGAGVNDKAGGRGSALMVAVRKGETAIARLLLEAGAEVGSYASDSPLNVAFTAAMLGRTEILELMIERNATLLGMQDSQQWTLLMYAAAYDRGEALRMLLRRGAEPDLVTSRGSTALMIAASKGNHRLAAALLDAGAHLEIPDEAGQTALLVAAGAEKLSVDVVRLLLERGADPNARRHDGRSALALAVAAERTQSVTEQGAKTTRPELDGAIEVVKTLLDWGADPRILDSNHDTALSLAVRGGHDKTAALLRGGEEPAEPQSGLRELELEGEQARRPAGSLAGLWNKVASAVPEQGDTAGIVLLGAILEILSGAPCRFACARYSARDMMGCYRATWGLGAGALSVTRDYESELDDSWQHVEAKTEGTSITGLAEGVGLSWDGEFYPMAVRLRGLSGAQEERVLAAARQVYRTLEYRRSFALDAEQAKREIPRSPSPPRSAGSAPLASDSEAWKRFHDSFFGDPYMAWHDGVDLGALNGLMPAEKERAERLLMESADWRGVVGLGELGSRRALPELKRRLETAGGSLRVHIAQAIAKIEGTDQSPAIVEVLARDPSPFSRLEAAIALGDGAGEPGVAQLYASVQDDDYLVRYHACNSLLRIHGFHAAIADYEDLFSLVASQTDKAPTDADRERFREAVARLEALFAGRGDPECAAAYLEGLRSPVPKRRWQAASILRAYDVPGVDGALFGALEDECHEVRLAAADSLLVLHGLPGSTGHYPEIYRRLDGPYDGRPTPADRERYRDAVRAMIDTIVERGGKV